MSIVTLSRSDQASRRNFIFDSGFRVFFLLASIFAIVSIAKWMLVFGFLFPISTAPLNTFQWHSHEMIYGYAMAVIAGFLLTAVINWTGSLNYSRYSIVFLASLWIIPRVLLLFGSAHLGLAGVFDIIFQISLVIAVALPIVKVHQWKQLGILTKLILLLTGNLCFYLGAFGFLEKGIYWGIYGGLYLIISLILTIGSRVMPAFIMNGVDYKVEINSPRWIFISGLIFFIIFFLNQLFFENILVLQISSLMLFVINFCRLIYWYTSGIWKKPLLWGLFSSFIFINIGFLLAFLGTILPISPFLSVHAFAYGGIGMATLSMMARVTLGHAGGNIKNPPRYTGLIFGILFLGALIRVGLPLLEPRGHMVWVVISQLFWIVAFGIFLIVYSGLLRLGK